jgi:hypothetical protein
MPRRQTPVLRNLDDPLRVLNLLSLRSCGLVLISYAVANALEVAVGLFTFLFGGFAFLGELAVAALVFIGLVLAERADDEHWVPSAIRYYLSRPWGALYSGMAREPHGSGRANGCRPS